MVYRLFERLCLTMLPVVLILFAGANCTIAMAAPGTVRLKARSKTEDGINVLFLMTDEQHYRSLSLTGNPYIETPHMDRIGREGVLFKNATCVTPYCSPSRASLINGLYPHTHNILKNVSLRSDQHALDQDSWPNTERILHQRGYVTAHRGKWHLGDKGDFDCYQSWAYASKAGPGYRRFLEAELPVSKFRDHPSPGKYQRRPVEMLPVVETGFHEFHAIPNLHVAYISTIGRSLIPPKLLPETQITNQILELLEKNADKNFMITASWSPPHDLWVIPEPYYSMVDRDRLELHGSFEMPEWDQRGASKRLGDIMGSEGIREYAAIYHGMVKYIDDEVGRVLAKLDELGLTDNTLVIFTSDHGDMVGAHGCIGKSIFSFYDDLVRIPLMIRLPGRIPAGTVVSNPVSQIDIMPTILDYTGTRVPAKTHGASLRPLINGWQVAWRDYAFCQRANAGGMIRTERFKFTYRPKPRTVTLYDLKKDPHEDHNLADDPAHAETVPQMHQRLLDVMTSDGDPMVAQYRHDPLGS